MAKIDREALELVEADLEKGQELTLKHVGDVFGTDFWELIVMLLLDAQDAARAIQGAVNRLRGSDDFDEDDDDDEE
jgi:hypothetical protein